MKSRIRPPHRVRGARSQIVRFAFTFALACGVAAIAIFSTSFETSAQTAPAKPAAAPARPAAAPARPAAKAIEAATKADAAKAEAAKPEIVEAQPVAHARSASISACLPAISELSRLTLDAPHMALSTWNKTDANDRLFSSIIGLKYENSVAPRALAIMSASPNPKRSCDGEAIQIQPSSLSCDAIQKNLAGPALKAQDLNGVLLVQGDGPLRFALLPTSGNGCTVVAIGTYFAR